MFNTKRFTAITAAALLTTAALLSTASPAMADTIAEPAADYCWVHDKAVAQCFETEDAMEAAIIRETGALPIEDASAVSRAAVGTTAVYLLARLYDATGQVGAYTEATTTIANFCLLYTASYPTMESGWNDRVSSVNSYNGCSTKLYTDASFGGSSITVTSPSSLNSTFNNKVSSFKVS